MAALTPTSTARLYFHLRRDPGVLGGGIHLVRRQAANPCEPRHPPRRVRQSATLCPFAYYDFRPVGWLMARMTSDCERLSNISGLGLAGSDLLRHRDARHRLRHVVHGSGRWR